MSGVGPLSQDWEPVVLRKKAPTAAAKKDEKAVNAARRAGADIDTVKKCSFSTRLPPAQKIDTRISFSLLASYFAKLKLLLITIGKKVYELIN